MEKNNKKILVVEDELPVQQALNDVFSQEGFTVLTAKNGAEGLSLALKEHPDIILLDIIMPEMGGLTMLKKLRTDEWGKTARVIVLTNLSDNEKVAEAVAEGAYDYFVKSDCNLTEVVSKVKQRLKI